jgi:hypothetical protein
LGFVAENASNPNHLASSPSMPSFARSVESAP